MTDEKEQGGFFSRLFGTDNLERGDPPDVNEALPERASDPDLPTPAENQERDDVESVKELSQNLRGGPDADIHAPAAANTLADEEAGASGSTPAGGGIIP